MTDWRHVPLSLSWSQGQAIYSVTEIPLYSWHMTACLPSYPVVHIPFRVFSGHLERVQSHPTQKSSRETVSPWPLVGDSNEPLMQEADTGCL